MADFIVTTLRTAQPGDVEVEPSAPIEVIVTPANTKGDPGEMGPPGPEGPQGEQGPEGPPSTGDDAYYVHPQDIAAATWIVTHNLGKHPSVTVVDTSENVVIGDIYYIDSNSLTLSFSAAFSGSAYLN